LFPQPPPEIDLASYLKQPPLLEIRCPRSIQKYDLAT
jgi:hypothetical protein